MKGEPDRRSACVSAKVRKANGSMFYGAIAGFEYEEGYQYEIVVQIDPVENPPADGSSLKYHVGGVVNKEACDW